jgi:2'-hydroxyisoflavone reductase
MKLLILGGTIFLGRHLAEAARARGHAVTLFNRGQHNPDLFPDVEKLRGNRDGDLAALQGRRWDAVVDTCGYVPRVVRASAELLADAVEHYTFISSISVYPHPIPPGVDEHAPVGSLDDPTVEEATGDAYGPLKALCEQAAEAAMLHLLACPHRQGRHGAGPRPARSARTDHRRPRPGRVDHPHGGRAADRRL